ncbi:potassium channel family protein [Atopobacter phocae]|uniref:potassium channel family protein n=1 Tax=Atopobacter phocae TaxID=136492 RepID=UPI000470B902|nr:potassium channel protein [Atopobacter phocae]
MKEQRHQINVLIILLLSLLFTGTIGYMVLLDLNLVDALYMTVITISTVGYGELGVMGVEAKLFSIILIFISLGTVGYLFSAIVSSFLEGDMKKAWRRRKMEAKIEQLKNHYIVCGAGETGYYAVKQFQAAQTPYVVIDNSEEKVNKLIEENIPAIYGDASLEETLERANISQAKGLISSLPTDALNVFTVLTARQMNPKIYIVSRAINKRADEKLKKAGANNTISPNEIGGTRMAALMLRPTVMSFLDIITHAGEVVLDLEDVVIFKNSQLLNKQLKDARIPDKTGLMIIAIKKYNGDDLIFNPSSEEVLEEGDRMVVLGRMEQVNILKTMANDAAERHLSI